MVKLLIALLLLIAGPVAAQDSLRLIVPDARPIVGEMIPITVRGEYTGAITLENMIFPDSAAYDWIQYSPDEWKDERIDGKLRRTFQRHIAVFANRPGTLTIGPVVHNLTKAAGTSRTAAPVTAAAVTVDVAAFPAPGRPLAARSLKVTDELSGDPAHIRDNQTIQRRITLTAQGSMAHLLPPRPALREAWLISFAAPEIRETRLTETGPVAFVQWEWSLRPITGEQGALPPMRFAWFDTGKREMRGAITPPIPFGYGKLAENTGGAARLPGAARGLIVGVVLAGVIAAMLGAVWGRQPSRARLRRVSHGLGHRLRYLLRRNPAKPALCAASRDGDLFALRRAADDFARHEAAAGRAVSGAALSRLDAALFAADQPGPFDRDRFLRDLTGERQG